MTKKNNFANFSEFDPSLPYEILTCSDPTKTIFQKTHQHNIEKHWEKIYNDKVFKDYSSNVNLYLAQMAGIFTEIHKLVTAYLYYVPHKESEKNHITIKENAFLQPLNESGTAYYKICNVDKYYKFGKLKKNPTYEEQQTYAQAKSKSLIQIKEGLEITIFYLQEEWNACTKNIEQYDKLTINQKKSIKDIASTLRLLMNALKACADGLVTTINDQRQVWQQKKLTYHSNLKKYYNLKLNIIKSSTHCVNLKKTLYYGMGWQVHLDGAVLRWANKYNLGVDAPIKEDSYAHLDIVKMIHEALDNKSTGFLPYVSKRFTSDAILDKDASDLMREIKNLIEEYRTKPLMAKITEEKSSPTYHQALIRVIESNFRDTLQAQELILFNNKTNQYELKSLQFDHDFYIRLMPIVLKRAVKSKIVADIAQEEFNILTPKELQEKIRVLSIEEDKNNDTALIIAIKKARLFRVYILLTKNIIPQFETSQGNSALLCALDNSAPKSSTEKFIRNLDILQQKIVVKLLLMHLAKTQPDVSQLHMSFCTQKSNIDWNSASNSKLLAIAAGANCSDEVFSWILAQAECDCDSKQLYKLVNTEYNHFSAWTQAVNQLDEKKIIALLTQVKVDFSAIKPLLAQFNKLFEDFDDDFEKDEDLSVGEIDSEREKKRNFNHYLKISPYLIFCDYLYHEQVSAAGKSFFDVINQTDDLTDKRNKCEIFLQILAKQFPDAARTVANYLLANMTDLTMMVYLKKYIPSTNLSDPHPLLKSKDSSLSKIKLTPFCAAIEKNLWNILEEFINLKVDPTILIKEDGQIIGSSLIWLSRENISLEIFEKNLDYIKKFIEQDHKDTSEAETIKQRLANFINLKSTLGTCVDSLVKTSQHQLIEYFLNQISDIHLADERLLSTSIDQKQEFTQSWYPQALLELLRRIKEDSSIATALNIFSQLSQYYLQAEKKVAFDQHTTLYQIIVQQCNREKYTLFFDAIQNQGSALISMTALACYRNELDINLAYKISVKDKKSEPKLLLPAAVEAKDVNLVQQLLKRQANVNIVDEKTGVTLIMQACKIQNFQTAKTIITSLLSADCKVFNIFDKTGNSILHHALKLHSSIFSLLFDFCISQAKKEKQEHVILSFLQTKDITGQSVVSYTTTSIYNQQTFKKLQCLLPFVNCSELFNKLSKPISDINDHTQIFINLIVAIHRQSWWQALNYMELYAKSMGKSAISLFTDPDFIMMVTTQVSETIADTFFNKIKFNAYNLMVMRLDDKEEVNLTKIKQFYQVYPQLKDTPILIHKNNKFILYGSALSGKWQLTHDLNTDTFEPLQSLIKDYLNMKSKIIPTMDDGDCAIHAIFGAWDGVRKKMFCKDANKIRQKIYDAVVDDESDSNLQQLIIVGITELIMSKTPTGDLHKALKLKYEAFMKTQDEKSTMQHWSIFEKKLQEYSTIIDHIEKNHAVLTFPSFYDKFYSVLSQKNKALENKISAIPELKEAFQHYNDLRNRPFNWTAAIDELKGIKKEYADFLKTPGRWLLVSELAIIAYILKITLLYYTSPSIKTPMELNKNKDLPTIEIQFNGINHYERAYTDNHPFIILSQQLNENMYQEITMKKAHFPFSTEDKNLVSTTTSFFHHATWKTDQILHFLAALLQPKEIIALLQVTKLCYSRIINSPKNIFYLTLMGKLLSSVNTSHDNKPALKIKSLIQFKKHYFQEYDTTNITSPIDHLKQAILEYNVIAVKKYLTSCVEIFKSSFAGGNVLKQLDHYQKFYPHLCKIIKETVSSKLEHSLTQLILEHIKFANGLSLIAQIKLLHHKRVARDSQLNCLSYQTTNCKEILLYCFKQIINELNTSTKLKYIHILNTKYAAKICLQDDNFSEDIKSTLRPENIKRDYIQLIVHYHPLILAAQSGDLINLIYYYEEYISLNSNKNQNQQLFFEIIFKTALTKAVKYGQIHTFDFLIGKLNANYSLTLQKNKIFLESIFLLHTLASTSEFNHYHFGRSIAKYIASNLLSSPNHMDINQLFPRSCAVNDSLTVKIDTSVLSLALENKQYHLFKLFLAYPRLTLINSILPEIIIEAVKPSHPFKIFLALLKALKKQTTSDQLILILNTSSKQNNVCTPVKMCIFHNNISVAKEVFKIVSIDIGIDQGLTALQIRFYSQQFYTNITQIQPQDDICFWLIEQGAEIKSLLQEKKDQHEQHRQTILLDHLLQYYITKDDLIIENFFASGISENRKFSNFNKPISIIEFALAKKSWKISLLLLGKGARISLRKLRKAGNELLTYALQENIMEHPDIQSLPKSIYYNFLHHLLDNHKISLINKLYANNFKLIFNKRYPANEFIYFALEKGDINLLQWLHKQKILNKPILLPNGLKVSIQRLCELKNWSIPEILLPYKKLTTDFSISTLQVVNCFYKTELEKAANNLNLSLLIALKSTINYTAHRKHFFNIQTFKTIIVHDEMDLLSHCLEFMPFYSLNFQGDLLTYCVEIRNYKALNYLLKHNFDVNAKNSSGSTAILTTLFAKDVPNTKLLLKSGAIIDESELKSLHHKKYNREIADIFATLKDKLEIILHPQKQKGSISLENRLIIDCGAFRRDENSLQQNLIEPIINFIEQNCIKTSKPNRSIIKIFFASYLPEKIFNQLLNLLNKPTLTYVSLYTCPDQYDFESRWHIYKNFMGNMTLLLESKLQQPINLIHCYQKAKGQLDNYTASEPHYQNFQYYLKEYRKVILPEVAEVRTSIQANEALTYLLAMIAHFTIQVFTATPEHPDFTYEWEDEKDIKLPHPKQPALVLKNSLNLSPALHKLIKLCEVILLDTSHTKIDYFYNLETVTKIMTKIDKNFVEPIHFVHIITLLSSFFIDPHTLLDKLFKQNAALAVLLTEMNLGNIATLLGDYQISDETQYQQINPLNLAIIGNKNNIKIIELFKNYYNPTTYLIVNDSWYLPLYEAFIFTRLNSINYLIKQNAALSCENIANIIAMLTNPKNLKMMPLKMTLKLFSYLNKWLNSQKTILNTLCKKFFEYFLLRVPNTSSVDKTITNKIIKIFAHFVKAGISATQQQEIGFSTKVYNEGDWYREIIQQAPLYKSILSYECISLFNTETATEVDTTTADCKINQNTKKRKIVEITNEVNLKR